MTDELEQAEDWLRWAMFAMEVAGFALTAYFLWEMVPERWKIDIRRGFRLLRAPLAAAEERKRARQQMWADVIELTTFGVPDQWAHEH